MFFVKHRATGALAALLIAAAGAFALAFQPVGGDEPSARAPAPGAAVLVERLPEGSGAAIGTP